MMILYYVKTEMKNIIMLIDDIKMHTYVYLWYLQTTILNFTVNEEKNK